MNWKALVTAALFAILGIAALVLYTRRLEIEASGGERVSVLMLSKQAKVGTILTEDQLSVRDIPVAYVDDRTVRANDKPKVLGVRVERDLEPQQLLSWYDVAVSGREDRLLSQLVPAGSRALTLHIPQQYMSSELLRPGDSVDVIGVVTEGSKPESVVLLQRVIVLAVGRETLPTRDGVRYTSSGEEQLVTIAVTLQESQIIALATQKGPVIAVLRAPEDQTTIPNVQPVRDLPTMRGNTTLRPLVAPGPTRPKALGSQAE